MTPYTSFLVLEDEPLSVSGSGRGDDIRIIRQNKFFEEKVSSKLKGEAGSSLGSSRDAYEQANVFMAPASSAAMKESEGGSAVHMSRAVKKIQSADVAVDFSKVAPDSLRYIEDKTFFKKGGKWLISTFDQARDEKSVVKIKFGSELYFKMLSKYPKAGRYCALGHNVVFELEGKFIEVGESGEEKSEKIESIFKN